MTRAPTSRFAIDWRRAELSAAADICQRSNRHASRGTPLRRRTRHAARRQKTAPLPSSEPARFCGTLQLLFSAITLFGWRPVFQALSAMKPLHFCFSMSSASASTNSSVESSPVPRRLRIAAPPPFHLAMFHRGLGLDCRFLCLPSHMNLPRITRSSYCVFAPHGAWNRRTCLGDDLLRDLCHTQFQRPHW